MIYLALGSNLGDREWNLEQALAMLAEGLKVDMLCSRVLETEALGFDGAPFLNQAVCFESDIAPEALLDLCQTVEERLGRPRHEVEFDAAGRRVFHDRTIDIDLLQYIASRDPRITHAEPFGHAQSPTLSDYPDGIDTLQFLWDAAAIGTRLP